MENNLDTNGEYITIRYFFDFRTFRFYQNFISRIEYYYEHVLLRAK